MRNIHPDNLNVHGGLKERRFADGAYALPKDPYDTARLADISDNEMWSLGSWIKARVVKDTDTGSWNEEYRGGVPLSIVVAAFHEETGYASVPPGAVIEMLYRLGFGAVLGEDPGPAMRFKIKLVRK